MSAMTGSRSGSATTSRVGEAATVGEAADVGDAALVAVASGVSVGATVGDAVGVGGSGVGDAVEVAVAVGVGVGSRSSPVSGPAQATAVTMASIAMASVRAMRSVCRVGGLTAGIGPLSSRIGYSS